MMLQPCTTDEIGTRVKAINRTKRWLAGASGVDPMTVLRGAKTVVRQQKLLDAICNEELRLLRHLASMYPAEAIEAASKAIPRSRGGGA